MKRLSLACAVFVVSGGLGLSAQAGKVVHIPKSKVTNGALVTTPEFIVQMNTRTEAGMSEFHDKETDTFYIVSGSATFVVGGDMVDAKVTAPGQRRGSAIRGGQEYQLAAGDVMVIPAGTPHWFKAVPKQIDYYVVKVLKP
jgi:mannose-6-phosphate isomerase-like protein (cupin superfamily)